MTVMTGKLFDDPRMFRGVAPLAPAGHVESSIVRYLAVALALGLAIAPAEPVAAQEVRAGVLTCDVSAGTGPAPAYLWALLPFCQKLGPLVRGQTAARLLPQSDLA